MSDPTPERPILIVRGENLPDHQWTLLKDETVIGRGDECDIVIPDRQISRQHIRITRDEDIYIVADLDSRNGTLINNQPLKGTRAIYDNDVISLSTVIHLTFVGSGATAPLPFRVPGNLGEGHLRLDPETRRLFIDGVELDPPLSLPQYRLMELLYNQMGRICTREQVIETVWPEVIGDGVSEQAIDALVRRLRDRLSEVDPVTQYVVTVRGHGFRLENA